MEPRRPGGNVKSSGATTGDVRRTVDAGKEGSPEPLSCLMVAMVVSSFVGTAWQMDGKRFMLRFLSFCWRKELEQRQLEWHDSWIGVLARASKGIKPLCACIFMKSN